MNRFMICVSLICLSSCSSSPKPYNPQTMEKITILGMNDFHGSLAPRTEKTYENPGKKSTTYQDGGASTFASFVKILKKERGPSLLVVDAGDEWQGTLDSNLERGITVVQFFNRIGVNVAAIGNHEFDFGFEPNHVKYSIDKRGSMKKRFEEANYPYVAANIYKKDTDKREEFPNWAPSKIFPVGGLKVGVIGLSTQFTPETTRYDYVDDLDFTSLRDATLEQASLLRSQGAQVIVVTTHAGLNCEPELGASIYDNKIRTPRDPAGRCMEYDEITKYLESMPRGTVDLVVSGHTHTIIHHWVNGTPVIQGQAYNHYFNLAHLVYDHEEGKVRPELTEIEGPIPVCEKVFKNLGHCNGKLPVPLQGRGELVTQIFHGTPITRDPDTEAFLKPHFAKTEKIKSRVIGRAELPIRHTRWEESDYGNLYTDIIREKLHADIGLMNSGGIRDSIDDGPITYDQIFRTLPFENTITRIEMTGRQLKLLLRIANNGSHGVFQVSGITVKMIALNKPAPSSDLDGNGVIEHWETNRILEVRDESGLLIDDEKTYIVATVDYLAKGGDNLSWLMNQIPSQKIRVDAAGAPRDAVIEYLMKHNPINTKKKPLKNPSKPRTIQV